MRHQGESSRLLSGGANGLRRHRARESWLKAQSGQRGVMRLLHAGATLRTYVSALASLPGGG